MLECHETKPVYPSLPRAFQQYQSRDQGTDGSGDLIITNKQNKQPSLMVGCVPKTR